MRDNLISEIQMVLDFVEQEKSLENVQFTLTKRSSIECREEYDKNFDGWGSQGEYAGYIEDPEPGHWPV